MAHKVTVKRIEKVKPSECERVKGVNRLYRMVSVMVVCIMVGTAFGVMISADTPTGFPTVIEPGGMVDATTFIIFKDVDNTTFAKNCTSGAVQFSSADSAYVIQSAIDASEKPGSIFIKGSPTQWDYQYGPATNTEKVDYVLDRTVYVPDGISVYGEGTTIFCGLRDDAIFYFNPTGEHYFLSYHNPEIRGFSFAGDWSNVNTTAIYVNDTTRAIAISELYTREISKPIRIEGAVFNGVVRDCLLYYGRTAIEIFLGTGASGANQFKIEGNDIESFDIGIVTNGYHIQIERNWFEGCNTSAIGYFTASSNRITSASGQIGLNITGAPNGITNNEFIIYSAATGVLNYNSVMMALNVVGNYFYMAGSDAKGVRSENQVTILTAVGNTITTAGSTTNASFVFGRFQYSVINGNYFQGGNPAVNISVGGAVNNQNVISGNTFYAYKVGIVYNGYYNIISGNLLKNGMTDLIQNGGATNSILDNQLMGTYKLNCTGTTPTLHGNIGLISDNGGVATFDGNSSLTYNITHGCAYTPTIASVVSNSADTWTNFTVTIGAGFIVVTYAVAPPVGVSNLKFIWSAQVSP